MTTAPSAAPLLLSPDPFSPNRRLPSLIENSACAAAGEGLSYLKDTKDKRGIMATTYTTRQDGEMLDLICYHHYNGRQSGAVELVLTANWHLRHLRTWPKLPAGVTIVLPDLPEAVTAPQTIRLWD